MPPDSHPARAGSDGSQRTALTALQLAGCGLMLAGMLLAQLPQASEEGREA